MQITQSTPVLPVKDVLKAIAFYETHLGFKRGFVVQGNPPEYATLHRDAGAIHVALKPETAGKVSCYLVVRGVDEIYEKLKQGGVRFSRVIEDSPYGMRDFNMLDVDGNTISVGEGIEKNKDAGPPALPETPSPPESSQAPQKGHGPGPFKGVKKTIEMVYAINKDGTIADYGLRQASIRLLAQALELVWGQHMGEAFRIAVSGNPDQEAVNPFNAGCRAVYTLASLGSMLEAVAICSELRSYFLRHYSGRCFRSTGETNFETNTHKTTSAHVYIAFFDKTHGNPAMCERAGVRLEWT